MALNILLIHLDPKYMYSRVPSQSVIFFGEKSPNGYRVFPKKEYSVTKFPVFEKNIRQKTTENWFFGDGVATFMPTDNSFQSFLK
jgi:hypothetical protein